MRELVGGAPKGSAAAIAAKAPVKPPVVVAAAPAETKSAPAAAPAPAPTAPAAEAKAAEKTAPKAPASSGGNDEVLEALNGWAAAWSKRNVDAYLAYYAKDFKTPKGEPRAEWEQGRRTRVMAPKSISVETDSPKVTMTGDKQASVTFRQRYRSDNINANSMKTLVLVKTDGGWRIQQEKVAN